MLTNFTHKHLLCMKHLLFLLSFCVLTAGAQSALELKQKSLAKWNIGSAQYSGIAPMGGNRYAVVSDKEPKDGFFIFRIDQNPANGEVTSVYIEGFKGNPHPHVDATGISLRDCEGVAYLPSTGTVFISGEGDQQILEYNMEGVPTGRKLNVPNIFALPNIVHNYGFEALTYNEQTHRFWTTTESTLPADGQAAGPLHTDVLNVLRLQAFTEDLQPVAQYAYRMDKGRTDDFGKTYVYGVPEMTALPDGRLLILEREANITAGGLSSECRCKLYIVNPNEGWQIDSSTSMQHLDPNKFLIKKLLASWKTEVQPMRLNFANYEAMCLGRTLNDGRRTLLLLNDSQGGYRKGPFHLKDYIKVIVLGE